VFAVLNVLQCTASYHHVSCGEVQYEQGPDSKPLVTGLLLAKAGQQQLAAALLLISLLFCLQAGAV
jgi:hypothetical protein